MAEAICDRVAIINQGRIQTQGTVQELMTLHEAGNLTEIFLQLVGRPEQAEILQVLREDHPGS